MIEFRIRPTRPTPILLITPDGEIKRHGKPIEQLTHAELLAVVRELVAMLCKGHSTERATS